MEGQVQKFLLGIVGVILLLSIIGATIGTVDSGAKNVGISERCGDVGCFYNASRGVASGYYHDCSANNVSNDNNTCTVAHTNTEFSGETLFSGGLLTTIVLLVSLMIIVGVAWIKVKNR